MMFKAEPNLKTHGETADQGVDDREGGEENAFFFSSMSRTGTHM